MKNDIFEIINIEQFFDTISVSIIIKDLNNKILKINKTAANNIGKAPQELEGKSILDLIGANTKTILEDDEILKETKKPILGKIEKIQTLKNEIRWVKVDKIPLMDKNNNIKEIIIVSQDLTEQFIAQEKAAKLELLANIGIQTAELVHNLKNSLAVAIGHAKLLEEKLGENENVNKLKTAQLRIVETVTNILNNSQGKEDSRKKQVNVEQSISNIIDGIKLQKDLSILTYTERWIEPNLIARIIPDHFEQIISNILNNAIEELSLKNDRKIIISASKEGSFVKVAIKDNGAGISPENIEKIFKAQFSTKSSSNSFHYGTGLGLSFCQRMIQNYGGDITVKTQLNKGTEFVCLFPEYVSQTKSLCEV